MIKKGILLITFITIGLSSCKYEDGPIFSFRSKQNRVAHKIGKYWKNEIYSLKMGQEGYALTKLGEIGVFDLGNWELIDAKKVIKFSSESNSSYELVIKELKNKKLKLEGAFPLDSAPMTHEFTLDKTIETLEL